MEPRARTAPVHGLVLLSLSLALLGVAAGTGTARAAEGSAPPTLRVVVELDLPTAPEAFLPDRRAVRRQRHAILSAQVSVAWQMVGTGFRVLELYRTLPFFSAELSPAALARLVRIDGVREVSGDDLFRPGLHHSVEEAGAAGLAGAGLDGRGTAVAVLDTGVDAGHPLLEGRVVAEACFSGGRSCPDGGSFQVGPGAGAACDYAAGCRHGTHVAGIVAGSGERGSGVAPAAELVSVQVFSRFRGAYCSPGGSCPLALLSDVVRALEHVYSVRHRLPVAAVNLSLGAGRFGDPEGCDRYYPALKAAVDQLRMAGIATVVAAGNDGWDGGIAMPACISSAVSVGATFRGRLAHYSNSADFLSLLAPGTGIRSAVPGGGLATLSGTSMAAPHVAGAFALLRQLDPEAGVDAQLRRLRDTGLPVSGPRGEPLRALDLRAAVARALDEGETPRLRLLAPEAYASVRGGSSLRVRWSGSRTLVRYDVELRWSGSRRWEPVARDLRGSHVLWLTPQRPPAARAELRVVGYDVLGRRVVERRTRRPVAVQTPPVHLQLAWVAETPWWWTVLVELLARWFSR